MSRDVEDMHESEPARLALDIFRDGHDLDRSSLTPIEIFDVVS
jgi:hypothetical protein